MAPRKFAGFIDLQVNGYMGVDFSGADLTEKACADSFQAILDSGTVGFLPTLITSSRETYRRNLPIIRSVMARDEFRNHVLGIHLEGPFLSPEPGAIGAHNPELATQADVAFLEEMLALCDGTRLLLTVAADVEGAETVIKAAAERGAVVSLGHQLALEEDLDRAVRAGATALTHLGNGLPLMLPRHPNTIFAGLAEDRLTAMIITDGHHIPPALIKTVLRTKGVERTVVTSDASPLAGLSPGEYHSMGADVVLEPSGRLHDPVKGNLVGSSYSMLRCMNVLAELDLVRFEDLYRLGVTNPLALIGMRDVPEFAGTRTGQHVAVEDGRFEVRAAAGAAGG